MDRFDTFVDKTPGQGPQGTCWTWSGLRRPEGYGRYCRDGTSVPASREAWERQQGTKFPVGHFACHHCDFPPCVRPEHIFPGRPVENTADSIGKGRFFANRNYKLRSHCRRGHALEGDNVTVFRDGKRECVTCRSASKLARRASRTDKIKYKSRPRISAAAQAFVDALGDQVPSHAQKQFDALIRALRR